MGLPFQEGRIRAPNHRCQAVPRGKTAGGFTRVPEALRRPSDAFATYAVEATGNAFAVADAMGHEDLKTTRIYQHPEFGAIRDAIISVRRVM